MPDNVLTDRKYDWAKEPDVHRNPAEWRGPSGYVPSPDEWDDMHWSIDQDLDALQRNQDELLSPQIFTPGNGLIVPAQNGPIGMVFVGGRDAAYVFPHDVPANVFAKAIVMRHEPDVVVDLAIPEAPPVTQNVRLIVEWEVLQLADTPGQTLTQSARLMDTPGTANTESRWTFNLGDIRPLDENGDPEDVLGEVLLLRLLRDVDGEGSTPYMKAVYIKTLEVR